MIKCTQCGNEIHPKRLEKLPTAKTCVACSTTEKKGGLTVMKGTGEDTWIEIIPMEQEEYKKIIDAENKYFKKPSSFDSVED